MVGLLKEADCVRKLTIWLIEFAAISFAVVMWPILYLLAALRTLMPRYQRVLDKLGFSIIRIHYYEPIYRASDVPSTIEDARSLPAIDFNVDGQLALISRFNVQCELLEIPLDKPNETSFGHLNKAYAFGDAESFYSMIRLLKPRRIYEIGSGQSTLLARKALAINQREDGNYVCDHVCVEPFEYDWLNDLGVTIIRQRVENVELTLFDKLESGDFLFIDGSHVIRPHGDTLREFNEILPRLAPGIYIHFHDIFSPFNYPKEWLVDARTMWDEQYLLESFLSFNSEYEVVLAVNWLKHNCRDQFRAAFPVTASHPDHFARHPGAFWIRRRVATGS
jgi:hypothetical protein